ncbi:MAG: glutamate-1-semialdehyde 2,1-aminomutase [Pseudomonadota bacterium]
MKESEKAYKVAKKYIPGGVNSPVRAFKNVDGEPIFISHAKSSYLYDLDGKKYIDYVGSWGPMILGHAHPEITETIQDAAEKGVSYGAPTIHETRLAKIISEIYPSMEKTRMVNSGTEATMSAIRLARGFTGRKKIIKFEGGYHGHSDELLVAAGSGATMLGEANSLGVLSSVASNTITLPYNSKDDLDKAFKQHGDDIACVIIEPVSGNMGCILPVENFLEILRKKCDQYETLLIFDEVMTGFRVALGGAQEVFGIIPDITTLGKIIGGGLPVGAFGGKAEIMDLLAPLGNVYQAGTLSGNPVAMAAGLKTIELISGKNFYKDLGEKTHNLATGLEQEARRHKVDLKVNYLGGMFGLFFTKSESIVNFENAKQCNHTHFKKFFHSMMRMGSYFAPSPMESGFMSSAHTANDIESTIQASEKTFKMVL